MKIGIIGGGAAGLVTAWLLEKSFKVILFENSDQLGGHALTKFISINSKTIPIDIGFEFFNSFTFPYFCKLLKILEVQLCSYPLTYTYYMPDKSKTLTLPIFQKKHFYWRSLSPGNIAMLLQLKYFLVRARSLVKSANSLITLEQFVNSLFLTKNFKDNFLYPFFGSGWGDSLDEFKKFAAYDILSWAVKNEPNSINKNQWNEIKAGTVSYISALVKQLETVTINLSSPIKNINFQDNHYVISQPNGINIEVDHIIIATNAYEAHKLLEQISYAQELRAALHKIEYFPTTIAIHGDQRLMPDDKLCWSVANVCFDGTYSNLTIYKSWKSDIPIFRSWITPNIATCNPPSPLYAVEHFFHAKVNSNYFEAQRIIKNYQGKNNLWLAGIYTCGIDSHESAVISAMNIAKQLAPHAERLKNLIKI